MSDRTIKKYLGLGFLAIVLLISMFLLYSWYMDVADTQVGSFEYVRKGEGLLREGDFKGSIKYFEKAYNKSPENSVIATKLRNACFSYASNLAETGDYDKSLECLNRASEVMPGPTSSGRLALIYAEKAVTAMRAGKAAEARSDLDSALEAASPYNASGKNLGIFLFNEAVTFHKSGNDETAIILLKESSLAYKGTPAFELLGDIYYNNLDLKSARFYFGKGLSTDRQNHRIRDKLKKSIMDLRSAQNRGLEESSHFEIRYDRSLPVNTQIVKDMLERCYFNVGNDLKYFPGSKTTIIFYSQEDFNKIFMMSLGTRAIYDGNIRIPLPEKLMPDRELAEYICHEYTHAIISAKTDNNCPVWLSEGLAVWEALKYSEAPSSSKMVWQPDGAKLTIKSLYAGFNHKDASEDKIRGDYALAYSAVRFIINTWGMSGISGILDRVKSGKHFTNAIDEEFLISEKDFEKRWKNYSSQIVS